MLIVVVENMIHNSCSGDTLLELLKHIDDDLKDDEVFLSKLKTAASERNVSVDFSSLKPPFVKSAAKKR
jgi:hypothetical protein